MGMGSGEPLDEEAIAAATNAFEDRLGECVHRIRYKNSRDGQFESACRTPHEARVTVVPGIHQAGGYFDIQWWTNGDYKYHYREKGLEFRFGREADNVDTSNPVRHFHPPSDLSNHLPSCIEGELPPELVTIAVGTTWFAAVKDSEPGRLNDQNNLP